MTPPPENTRQNEPAGSTDRIERRKRMRIFQTELVERMQAARDQTEVRDNRLGVVIGGRRWLLDMQEIGEIVPFSSITKVPLTQDWYLGLLNIRGNLVSVIDFARYQGLPPTETDSSNRVITFSPALGINCGLLVTRVLGLRNVTEMQPMSAIDVQMAEWALDSYRDSDSQEWTGLSLSAIAQEQRFLHIGV
jgi:twitching motility protein PilI